MLLQLLAYRCPAPTMLMASANLAELIVVNIQNKKLSYRRGTARRAIYSSLFHQKR